MKIQQHLYGHKFLKTVTSDKRGLARKRKRPKSKANITVVKHLNK